MNKKKNHTRKLIYSFLGLFCFSLVLTSCDAGFDQMNVDETDISNLDPIMVLNNQIRSTPGAAAYGFLLYDMHIVQQMVTPHGQTFAGGNFNVDNQFNWVNNYWGSDMGLIRQLVDTIERTRGDDAQHNVHQMARIFRALVGLKMTDTMGDVPFSEAGLGVYEEILYPVYDSQEEIYNAALSEIQEATAALDANQRIPFDLLYAGDIAKWKRFGNSLLLRYAMRLSERAPGTAEQYVTAAFNGGVFQSNDDNAMVLRNNDYSFSYSGTFNGGESYAFYLTDVFVDYLKNTNDPRLESIAVRYVGATSTGDQNTGMGETHDAADQIGMPIGHDVNTIGAAAQADGVGVYHGYSQVDRHRIANSNAPDFIVTHAQTQLLLAEAAERGWVGGLGVDYYAAGVRANLEQMAMHHPDMAIPQNEIDDFVTARSVAYLAGDPYEEIHNQYWVAGFLITPREVFSNWRRTNYPTLQENPYPNQDIDGDFIRRRTYPNEEFNANSENIEAAIQRQGWSGNVYDARVWWDVDGYNP